MGGTQQGSAGVGDAADVSSTGHEAPCPKRPHSLDLLTTGQWRCVLVTLTLAAVIFATASSVSAPNAVLFLFRDVPGGIALMVVGVTVVPAVARAFPARPFAAVCTLLIASEIWLLLLLVDVWVTGAYWRGLPITCVVLLAFLSALSAGLLPTGRPERDAKRWCAVLLVSVVMMVVAVPVFVRYTENFNGEWGIGLGFSSPVGVAWCIGYLVIHRCRGRVDASAAGGPGMVTTPPPLQGEDNRAFHALPP